MTEPILKNNNEYSVENILDKKSENGIIKYKVKWLDYPMNCCTWEPSENLTSCNELLDEFNKKLNDNSKENLYPVNNSIQINSIKWNYSVDVLDAKIINDSPIELNCLVRFRSYGNLGSHSIWITSNIVRKKNPELLLKYYERMIR